MCTSQVATCMSLFKDTKDVQLWLSLVWDGIHKGKAEAQMWNALRRCLGLLRGGHVATGLLVLGGEQQGVVEQGGR